jgi:hypothetical protein
MTDFHNNTCFSRESALSKAKACDHPCRPPRFGSQVNCGVISLRKGRGACAVCMCGFFNPGGRLDGGREARFGRVVECFGFIEPMKIVHGYTLVLPSL